MYPVRVIYPGSAEHLALQPSFARAVNDRAVDPQARKAKAWVESIKLQALAQSRIKANMTQAFGGYAAVFNRVECIHGNDSVVRPGAFETVRNVTLLENHCQGVRVLASQYDATLHVEEDAYGFWIEGYFSSDTTHMSRLRRGEFRGVSIGKTPKGRLINEVSARGVLINHQLEPTELSLISAPYRPASMLTWVRPLREARIERTALLARARR